MIRRTSEFSEKAAYISSYTPPRCGIATFTSDLIEGMGVAAAGRFEPVVRGMDSGTGQRYAQPVEFVIRGDSRLDYIAAADYINNCDDMTFFRTEPF